ncbi:MAG: carbohydrate ABC transporter permease [Treponema sp.]|jgi:putative aldouronate transport system permease protein|nr:carbohydrate ABC transporter permease [Treponema sp.]
MKIREETGTKVFNTAAALILIVLSILCVLPFVVIVSGSFTDNDTILSAGYSVFPRNFTTAAYKTIFENPDDILQAYRVTIFVTIFGTALGLAVISMTGYVLSRREFRYRNVISFLIYFTSIFGGGLVPWYFMYTGVLQSKGTLFPIIIPGLMSPFLIIIMRTFIVSALPHEVTEAAIVDGAGNFTIFCKVVLPVVTPGLATVGLFLALGYWNDWYRSSLFSTDSSTWMLQYYLYNMVNRAEALRSLAAQSDVMISDLPRESVKLAMAVVVTGPILLLYPFVQKYFVSGITIGAVKG